jgi:GTPase
MFTVAIIGRPNVGKSTLYNRLVGKGEAIVEETAGVTRDWQEGEGRISSMHFRIIDTAGLEQADKDSLEHRMLEKTEQLLADEVHVVLFAIDGRTGVTPLDRHFAKWLRSKNIKTILVVNKCEGHKGTFGLHESYGLGFGDPVAISAAHGEGMADLYYALAPLHEEYTNFNEQLEAESKDKEKPINIAIVGRPNAGKSTFINKIIKQNRLLTGAEAGITRDAISIKWQYKERDFKVIDTAGLRKKSKVANDLETMSCKDSLQAIQYANVVALLIDATSPFDKQDLIIASHVVEEGRAIIVVINKIDLIENKEEYKKELEYKITSALPQVKGVPMLYISALHGSNIYHVMDEALKIYDLWNQRITTSKLNDWLKFAMESHSLPMSSLGRRIRIKYVTQYKTRPPTFGLFCSRPEEVAGSYLRYLTNSLRDYFGMYGVPIRMLLKKGSNPYKD